MARMTRVPSRSASILMFSGFLVLCGAAAGIGGLLTSMTVDTWYRTLERPTFAPPDWVFGPVWSTLYLLMAIAAFLTWRQGWPGRPSKVALGLFGLQLALNVLWSGIFFGLQAPGAALIELVVLWAAILAWAIATGRVSRLAAPLIVPYLAWVSFAGVLNAAFWRLN